MANLTKREIALTVTAKTKFPLTQVTATVQGVLDTIQDALAKGRNVELRNFGVLEVQTRKARVGRNPMNPTVPVSIPARTVVKFKAGKILKQQIKQLPIPAPEAKA